MAVSHEQIITQTSTRAKPSIEFLTENGFSIIRRSDIDPSFSIDGPEHCFVVRDTDGYELDITVDILPPVVAEIIHRTRGRLSLASSYWINCAERHLAAYLWEHDDYPPNGNLQVDQLTLDDLDLARRWGRGQNKD